MLNAFDTSLASTYESLIKGADYKLPYYPDYAIDSEYYNTLSEKSYIYIYAEVKRNIKRRYQYL